MIASGKPRHPAATPSVSLQMPEYLRALTYVLIVSIPAFYIARRIAVPLIDEDEFRLWRNCWFATTCATFLSRSFLDFAFVLILMSIYILRYSKRPVLLYLVLMFAAPCVAVGMGIPPIFNRIIDLNPPRLLALLILLPIAVDLWRNRENRELRGTDAAILAFFGFVCLLSLRLGDFNSILRVVPGYFLDILLPYFVFSRALRSAQEVNQALLAFAVATMPLAAVGMFEIWRSWRVYYVVLQEWDVFLLTAYLFRDGLLRAATTSVESIAFGFLCMAGGGCLLALRTRQAIGLWRYAALALMMGGLLSSVSRGPWLGFAFCAVVLLLTNLRRSLRLLFGGLPVLLAVAALHPTFIDRFINLLPFVGSADRGSETYRSQLFENSMIVIGRYPLLGSETFLGEPEMLRMIQGQGIVDVVNSYLQVALQYGLIGLVLFLLVFGMIAAKTASLFLRSKTDLVSYQGYLALLLAVLFTIATTSSVSVIPHIYWALAGIGAALVRLGLGIQWEFVEKVTGRMRTVGIGPTPPIAQPTGRLQKMRVVGGR
ncbi:O-antigen ligase family protein [Rhizobiaceae bacterium LC148]|nr:hypothetical protein YH62_15080 [Rhizobium sp. LC145]TKT68528.1 O-antigen ligase family protein [Rhizobiaceae bacterium LC148]